MNERVRLYLTAVSVRGHGSTRRERIERFQNRKLRQVVRHAYENVPYYTELFDRHGLHPSSIRIAADLHRIPITRKIDVRCLSLDDLLAKGVDRQRLFERDTSGVTGEPFTIRRTPREELMLSALFLRRELRGLGVRRGDRIALIKAHSRTRNSLAPRRENALTVALRKALIREAGTDKVQHLNAFRPLDEIIQELLEGRPTVITGYPGILSRIAARVEASGIANINPRVVITGAEVLTTAMRQQIGRAFGARVYDTYGSCEFGRIATECVETGEYHICDDSVLVEVIKEGRPATEGETGTVIATNLHSYAMPFIRFALGDLAVQGRDNCSCGSPFRTLRQIMGRTIDNFRLPDGSDMHPWTILDAVWPHIVGWMTQYRFVQESPGRVVMSAVPRRMPSAAELDDLDKRAKSVLGREVEFTCRVVGQLEPDASGKTRVFRSLVHAGND
jgi:phenylacetate-CoA ligase